MLYSSRRPNFIHCLQYSTQYGPLPITVTRLTHDLAERVFHGNEARHADCGGQVRDIG